ncbi:uncharacterized protein At4g15545 isoform X2 [Andrographis paniculata]|uniref:uncharacterized protein At4g15545 isoform X2 n=1 Tax=Andrographis paniculata TaxID=175694 RepID=UPI0021E8DDA5|nr:uncharacterized protein At4g15545 isoform X2 [Andrographis paniculata]
MQSKDSAGAGGRKFDLPEELLEVLPSDPFEQLDVARKITSIALSTRVSALESEAAALQQHLDERDAIISDLESQLESLDASLADTADRLAAVQEEKESLLKENAELSNTVKKLNRDVVKLEAFRKKLMQSLQDDEDNPASASITSRKASIADDDTGNSNPEDVETDVRPRISQSLLIGSQTSTPRLTPPGSPPHLSASGSPSRTPKLGSPRRQSLSFSTARSVFDEKSNIYSSVPSTAGSASSLDSGSQPGKTRVDGKEFFRQVRNRLSLEQFGAFLANVKELNANKQTKEETLQKADEIFGVENKDLYSIFEGLIARNIH